MAESVLRLFPQPAQDFPLEGLYLDHDLRQFIANSAAPYVYSNYISSLDGRIAVPHPDKPGLVVPDQIANPRDWRLFQELAVQADILITSGRYLRDYEDGRAQEILAVYKDPRFIDLAEWRSQKGLKAKPDLAVISASLKFPIPPALTSGDRRMIIITTRSADKNRITDLENQSANVIIAGEKSVSGSQLLDALYKLEYRLICNTTGPKVHHLLLKSRVMNRLYLTFASRLLSGNPFATVLEGELLESPADCILNTLYWDPHALSGSGQLFSSYNISIPKGFEG